MKSKRMLLNVFVTISMHFISILSGFIIRKIIIETYGSATNGIIAAVDQIVSSLVVLEAGIGSSTAVLLYKPLVEKDYEKVNKIINTANYYYKRTGFIYIVLLLLVSFVYPRVIQTTQDIGVIQLLVLITASTTIIDYFFYAKYRILLESDQKIYVISIIQIVASIISVILMIILMKYRLNFILIKVIVGIIYFIRFIACYIYVQRHYRYIKVKYSKENLIPLHQRWSVLVHQIASIIVNNTDLVILTIAMGYNSEKEVSVYGIYLMIANALSTIVYTMTSVFTAGFGHLLVQSSKDHIKKAFQNFEIVVFVLIFIVYTCFAILYLPFIKIYTSTFTDYLYYRPVVALLFVAIGFLQTIRIPGVTVIAAAGHFKETVPRAILELSLNLIISIALVKSYGIIGVLIGTFISYFYRSTDIIIYNAKKIIPDTLKKSFIRIFRNLMVAFIIIYISTLININPNNYIEWLSISVIYGICIVSIYFSVNAIFEPELITTFLARFKSKKSV